MFNLSTTSLDPWSCTDRNCAWKEELKRVQNDIASAVPLTDFCHHIEKRANVLPEKLTEIPDFFNSDTYKIMAESTFLQMRSGITFLQTSHCFIYANIMCHYCVELPPLNAFHMFQKGRETRDLIQVSEQENFVEVCMYSITSILRKSPFQKEP